MDVSELIKVLQKIEAEGKGHYKVYDEGYCREIDEEDIDIEDEKHGGTVYF